MASKNKIRILYIVPHRDTGGAEKVLIYLLKNIDREKFYPVVIVPEGPLSESFNDIGIKTYLSHTNYLWLPTQRYYYKLLSDLKERLSHVMEIVQREHIDIIHTNDYWAIDGGLTSRLTGIPHIWHLHIPLMSIHPVFEYFPLQPSSFSEIINELSDKIVAVSYSVKQSLIPYIPEHKIEVIYNGIEFKKTGNYQAVSNLRQDLGINRVDYIVTSIGRICQQKNFEDFVECAGIIFRQKYNVKFLLVGPTDDNERAGSLKKRVKELGLEQNFFFLGRRNDIPDILAETDIFVSSSLYEGHPLVILEAMASEKPVVATSCAGSKEAVIDNETGYLVEINKPDKLAETILKLLENRDKRINIGIQGKKRVESTFSLSAFVKNFETLYSQTYESRSDTKRSKIWPEFIINTLSEIGKLGLKSLEHEYRLNQFENFITMLKGNFLYRATRKAYQVFTGIRNRIKSIGNSLPVN